MLVTSTIIEPDSSGCDGEYFEATFVRNTGMISLVIGRAHPTQPHCQAPPNSLLNLPVWPVTALAGRVGLCFW
jgi:hypothetical protein